MTLKNCLNDHYIFIFITIKVQPQFCVVSVVFIHEYFHVEVPGVYSKDVYDRRAQPRHFS